MAGRVKVTRQTKSGRNTHFRDTKTRRSMTRSEFVRSIKAGKYPKYHTRNINGTATPVSNPDKSSRNNLG